MKNNHALQKSTISDTSSLTDTFYQVHWLILLISLFFITSSLSSCSAATSGNYSHPTQRPYSINNKIYYPIPSSYGFNQKGIASWYGKKFHGKKTSNGETYDMYGMTAAHKTLPMNTVLLIRSLENNKEIVVRVNDRGPFVKGRIIDLSYTGAKKLDLVGKGTAKVQIIALGDTDKNVDQIKKMARNFYTGEFYVQIGSFKTRQYAKRLKSRFIKAGHNTYIQKYYSNDSVYHRVRVYVGKTLEGARQAQRILESRGYKNAFVIAR